MNGDGFLDLVGQHQTQYYAGVPSVWGTTVFLNDGTGAFQIVDGAELLAGATTTPPGNRRWNLGSFMPTIVTRDRTEGVVYEMVGGCGGTKPGCTAPVVNLYKVVANGSIGTGPSFADSERLGVPGFNEFYYLRHHADAQAAVSRGEFRNGLEHYLSVGRNLGYDTHAQNPLQ